MPQAAADGVCRKNVMILNFVASSWTIGRCWDIGFPTEGFIQKTGSPTKFSHWDAETQISAAETAFCRSSHPSNLVHPRLRWLEVKRTSTTSFAANFSLVHPQEKILTVNSFCSTGNLLVTAFVGCEQNPFNLAAKACQAPQQTLFPPTQAQVWGEHVLATSREDRTSVTIVPSIKWQNIHLHTCIDQIWASSIRLSMQQQFLEIWTIPAFLIFWVYIIYNKLHLVGQAGTQWVDNPTPPPVQDMVPWAFVKFKEIERIEWAGPIVNQSFLQSIFPKCFRHYRMSKSCEGCFPLVKEASICHVWWDLQVYQWVDNPSYGRPAATPPQPYVQVGQLCHLWSLFQFVSPGPLESCLN